MYLINEWIFCLSLIFYFVNYFLTLLIAAVGFLVIASSVTMSAPFFLGKVIDTIYSSSTEDFTASLTSLCFILTGVFLCGGAANAARVYLMQISGEVSTRIRVKLQRCFIENFVAYVLPFKSLGSIRFILKEIYFAKMH